MRDQRVDLAELWGAAIVDPLVDGLQQARDVWRAADLVEAAIAARLATPTPVDELAAEARRRIGRGASVGDLDDLGLGERQLRRRCLAAFGYGPKLLGRVLRFQAFLDRIHGHPDLALTAAAADAGYADQAHLSHDVVALAGLTPGRLRAALMSDTDKTQTA